MAKQKTIVVDQGTELETKNDLMELRMTPMDSEEFFKRWERVNKFVPLTEWQDDMSNEGIATGMQIMLNGLADYIRDAHVDIHTLVDNKGAAREIYRTAVVMTEGAPSVAKGASMNLQVRGHAAGYTVSINESRIHLGTWDHADIILQLARPATPEKAVYVSLRLSLLKTWKTGYPINQIIDAIKANLPV